MSDEYFLHKKLFGISRFVSEKSSGASLESGWQKRIRELESRSWWSCVIWAPLFVLVIYVVLFGVDIPFGDPWQTLLPHIVKFYQGELTFADLLSQNNEHRPLFPRLILIPLAVLTQWNTRMEMGIQIGFSVATFFVIKYQLSITLKRFAMLPSNWLLLIVSLLVFSLNQWENWLNGYQLLYSLFSFASVACICSLANSRLTNLRFGLGLVCALVAQYTIVAGLILWFIGLILLLITTEGNFRKVFLAVIWLTVASISTFLYFRNFHFLSDESTFIRLIWRPDIYVLYVFTFLGAPMMTYYLAFIFGVGGTYLLIILIVDTWQKRFFQDTKTYLPYVALCLHSFLIALSVGIGRSGEKWWLALSPRYVGFSVWFWVGLVSLLYLKASVADRIDQTGYRGCRWRRCANGLLACVFVLSTIWSMVGCGLGIYLRYLPLRSTRAALINGSESEEALVQIFPDASYLREQLLLAREYRLSVYR